MLPAKLTDQGPSCDGDPADLRVATATDSLSLLGSEAMLNRKLREYKALLTGDHRYTHVHAAHASVASNISIDI